MTQQAIDPNLARQFDRLPPQDVEAEQCLLGSLLYPGGTKYLAEVRGVVDREMFYSSDHQAVWDAVLAMAAEDRPVDPVTLRATMERRGVLRESGGTEYVAHLFNVVPFAAHAVHYAERVREQAVRRKAIEVGNDLIRIAFEPMEPADVTAAMMRQSEEIIRAASAGARGGPVRLGEAVGAVLDRCGDPKPRRQPTGLRDVDALIGGIGFGLTTVIAGQAGMGKSQLMKQVVRNAAGADVPCGIITVEENREKIAENYLAGAANVDSHRIAFDRLNEGEWGKMFAAAPALDRLPIFIEDAAFSLPEIEVAAHRLVAKYGCRLIAVDHMHLVTVDGERNRVNEVSRISSGLKRLYRKLGVAGITLAQLNRNHQQGERPTLRSLRDSGTIEQDGDVILLLHREDYFKYGEPDYVPTNELEIHVAKNKFGGPGVAKVRFNGGRQTITDLSPVVPF